MLSADFAKISPSFPQPLQSGQYLQSNQMGFSPCVLLPLRHISFANHNWKTKPVFEYPNTGLDADPATVFHAH
jgi:hypothetical protein